MNESLTSMSLRVELSSLKESLTSTSTFVELSDMLVELFELSFSEPSRRMSVLLSVLVLPMLTSSPAKILVEWSSELSTFASSPAATALSPEATMASLSKICMTSPWDQMFWLTDWSVIVSRSSTEVYE